MNWLYFRAQEIMLHTFRHIKVILRALWYKWPPWLNIITKNTKLSKKSNDKTTFKTGAYKRIYIFRVAGFIGPQKPGQNLSSRNETH